jgi:hypothetical protein
MAFFGRVHPPGASISIDETTPLVDYNDPDKGLTAKVIPVIYNSRVSIDCYFNKMSPNYRSEMILIAFNSVRARIDLESFRQGVGAVFAIDWMKDCDGSVRKIRIAQDNLSAISTSFTSYDDNYTRLKNMITNDQPMSLALNDLILAQTAPMQKEINCARAIEGIRHMIAGQDTDPKVAWPIMREKLNLDRQYLSLITDNAIARRPGEYHAVDDAVSEEILRRSWIMMDRFFHYRLRGDTQLPLTEFPLLLG